MKLTHSQCKALAGDPLILAASEEQEIRKEWEKRDRVYKAAMRWFNAGGGFFYRTGHQVTSTKYADALERACAKAKK